MAEPVGSEEAAGARWAIAYLTVATSMRGAAGHVPPPVGAALRDDLTEMMSRNIQVDGAGNGRVQLDWLLGGLSLLSRRSPCLTSGFVTRIRATTSARCFRSRG